MGKNATLKDIAARCGCSITTVSRALKDSDTISAAMKRRIKAVADELGYIPNALAGSMRTGSTRTIAVILQDFRNPFFAVVAKYLEEYAHSLGYFVLYATTNESSQQELDAVRTMLGKNVDGVLLFPIQKDDASTRLLMERRVPFVLVGRRYEALDTNYVITDEQTGAYLVTRHMIEGGARNILFLNTFDFIYSARERRKGYLRAVREAGLECRLEEVSMEMGETRQAVRRIFSPSGPLPYDGLLIYCDIMGAEAYHTLAGMGLRIPEDLQLGSLDGIQQDIILPVELTSAGIDRKRMVTEALDILLADIHNHSLDAGELPRAFPNKIMLEQYLLEGQTCLPARKKVPH